MKHFILLLVICFSFQFAPGQLFIQNGSTLQLTGNAHITLQDINLVNEGTLTATNTSRVIFTGNGNNQVSGVQKPVFGELEINKTGSNKLVLQREIDINGKMVFTSGLIDLNTHNINLGSAAFLESENENSRVTGSNGGQLIFQTSLNAPVSANPANLGAILTSTADLGTITIRRGHQSQMNAYGNGSSVLRYYDILPANNSALNATLRFHYFDAELNSFNENTLVLWKSVNNIHWSQQGFSERNTVTNYVEKTGIPDFSRWTLSSLNNPLPVLFSLFNIRCLANTILVNWKTAQEQNSAYFNIERSQDGMVWTLIGTVPSTGNSTIERSYAFTDGSPVNGAMYRVAQYDIDGHIQYTPIIRADCGEIDNWKLWPNPVQEKLWVHIKVSLASSLLLKIYDSKGSLIRSQQHTLLPGTNQLNIHLKSLPPGMYQVIAEWGKQPAQRSAMIIKI